MLQIGTLLYSLANVFWICVHCEKIMSRGRYGFLLSCFSLILFGWMSQSFLVYLHRFVWMLYCSLGAHIMQTLFAAVQY
jgi:hypothetical protein